jgi:metallo-beta-lactamase class B
MIELLPLLAAFAAHADETPIVCSNCDAWNRDVEPFRITGNTYFVGTEGLSSVLVTGDDGHVLIDGALPQSAALIAAHVSKLGFRIEDVKWVLNSHAHFDHSGGIAALARMSGAKVGSSALAVPTLESGKPADDDPQPFVSGNPAFPAVANVQSFADGEVLRVGDLAITVEHTPGHTPGGTSYRGKSCEGDTCVDVVYADSLTAVSLPPFRYTDHPEVVANLKRSIADVRALPCDVLVSAHPSASKLFERRDAGMLVKPTACGEYADKMQAWLSDTLAKEAGDATR